VPLPHDLLSLVVCRLYIGKTHLWLTLEDEGTPTFEMFGAIHPKTQHQVAQNLNSV
jgi:hypothetical protein